MILAVSGLRGRRAGTLSLVTATTLLVGACGGVQPGDVGSSPTIVVTTDIWADVVSNAACADVGDVQVQSLVPSGADPHAFEPSLADRRVLDDAVLVVANGAAFEEVLEDTLEAVEAEGVPVVRLADEIGGGGEDPHIWFDPQLVQSSLEVLAERLVDDAGLDPEAVRRCVDRYQTELATLDRDVAELVGGVPPADRALVTSHDVLGHFADRYGFEILGAVIPSSSTLAQPSPARLEELAQIMELRGVRAVFAESQQDADVAEALAARVGDVDVVTLLTGTLGEPGGGADTYLGYLRTNARLIVDALTRR